MIKIIRKLHYLSKPWFSTDTVAEGLYDHMGINRSRLIRAHYRQTLKLIIISVVGLTALLFWAALAHVPQSAAGTAKVVPSSRLQVVQAVDGGVITDLLVSEGDSVEKGQVLIQIDTTRFNSGLNERKAMEAALLFKEARLKALLTKKPFAPPVHLVEEFKEIYQQESKLLDSITGEWSAQIGVLKDQLNQKIREKQEAESRMIAAGQSLKLLRRELSQMKPLLRSGAISEVEIMRMEKQVSDTNGDYEASKAQIRRLRAAIEEAEGKIKEETYKINNKARTELTEVTAKLASIRQNKVELSDRVEQATIRAPLAGKIQRILYNTLGAVVPAGREVVEIVPIDDELVFDTRIQPKDIGFIRPDQAATIRVSAYEFSIYGNLKGYVESISADSIQDEYGNPYYQIRIVANKESVPAGVELIPGMTAEVSIMTEQRTVLSYLTKPLTRGLNRAFTER